MENRTIKSDEKASMDEMTEIVESTQEENAEEQVGKVNKPLSKYAESKALMENAEVLVSQADKEVQEVESIVSEHVAEFKKNKEKLATSILSETKNLLEKANYEYSKEEPSEPFELSLGTTKEKVKIKKVTTGRLAGFLLALLGMVATIGAWLFFAIEKTGTDIGFDKIPEPSTIDTILLWIGGGMTGSNGNVLFGIITLALSSLFIGFLIYQMYVSINENINYKVASKAFEKSHIYVEEQKESKSEMERIDQHIVEATPLIESYLVILNEQNAKLQRILYVEGSLENMSDYHPNSKHIMDETSNLMKRAERFVHSPVSKGGKFNEDSLVAYREAKALASSYIAQAYA